MSIAEFSISIGATIPFVQFLRQRLINFTATLGNPLWVTVDSVGKVDSDKKDPLE